MGAGINVIRLAFEGGPVIFLRLGKFPFLEINIAQLKIMVRIADVVDLPL